MTTDETRSLFLSIAGKSSSKYFKASDINRYINRAQMQYMNQKTLEYAATRANYDSLMPFRPDPILISLTNGIGSFPTDYQYLDVIRYRYFINPENCEDPGTPNVVPTYVPVDIIPDDKLSIRLSSKIDMPTMQYPVGVLRANNRVQVYPTTIQRVEIVYIRQPLAFNWAFTLVNDRQVYDPTSTLNQPLEWLEIDQDAIVMLALSMAGVNMRDFNLTQYAEMKQEVLNR